MAQKAIDTAALLDFFKDGPVASQVEELLIHAEKRKQPVLISSLTWGDLYQHALKQSTVAAEKLTREIAVLPIEVVLDDQHLELTRAAVHFQTEGKTSSLSEAFSAAVAKVYRAELWTTSKNLSALKGEIKVHYLSAQ